MDQNNPIPTAADVVIEVFVAEPNSARLVVEVDGDTPEEVAERQDLLDALSGWVAPRP